MARSYIAVIGWAVLAGVVIAALLIIGRLSAPVIFNGGALPIGTWLTLLLVAAVAAGGMIALSLDQYLSGVWRDLLPDRHRAEGKRDLRLGLALTIVAVVAVAGATVLLAAPGAVVEGASGQLAVDALRSDSEARLRGALVLLLAGAGSMAVIALLADLSGGRTVNIESHWGGLGGGAGGWTVSSPLIALIIALSCLGGMVTLANSTDPGRGARPKAEDEKVAESGREVPSKTRVIEDKGVGKRTAAADRSE